MSIQQCPCSLLTLSGCCSEHCNNLLTCYSFHMNSGLRAGGGIGDELESAIGHPLESYRFLFDLSFFFFVTTILLAIVQVCRLY